MSNQDFSLRISINAPAEKVFKAITNVRGWWSEEIDGNTENLNDEFSYHYTDVHRCKIKLAEVVPGEKMVWLVLENYFSFTKDQNEWKDTTVSFEITGEGDQSELLFIHHGLVPELECYSACSNGWTQYVQHSLVSLITTGKGQPNASEKAMTTHEVAARFHELAQQEKWFEIQDALFSENVKSIEPAGTTRLPSVEGKAAVRRKGEDWVKQVEGLHRSYTSSPVVGGPYFAVGRELDITVTGLGRIQTNEVMLYEVKNGEIVSEQFFY